ncbi:MAG: multidrug efflux SMR transporter [Chloroflexaceae bacterium]|nr:multidrug efflux SMR transporter [Chloroflexaceae bacterium]
MPAFVMLLLAITCEVIATAALKVSAGMTRLVPGIVVVIGYAMAFYFLSISIKQLPLGPSYAIWSGLGTVGAVALGVLIWHEKLDAIRVIGIVLIIAGVVLLQMANPPD